MLERIIAAKVLLWGTIAAVIAGLAVGIYFIVIWIANDNGGSSDDPYGDKCDQVNGQLFYSGNDKYEWCIITNNGKVTVLNDGK